MVSQTSISLSDFIRHHHRELIENFESFARTFSAVAAHMTSAELQDHCEELLTAIVADMESPQTDVQQADKSVGLGLVGAMESSGLLHAEARILHRFNLAQVLAEFRALRASVLASYDADSGPVDLTGIRRFNEAVDEAMTISMVRFSDHVESYRDQFIGVLGHDLRTPLSAITAGAVVLSARPDGDPQASARMGALILRSAHRMDAMIADLLDFTRTRLGTGIPIKPASADLAEICGQAMVEARLVHPATPLSYEASGDLKGIWDAARLQQVVTNLLMNAFKHGAGTAVRMTARGTTETVTLAVHNFGPEIPAELHDSIFEPLIQYGGAAHAGDGLGLGLFIVRAIVAAHDGKVTVRSGHSSGTTFEVQLPRHVNADAHAAGHQGRPEERLVAGLSAR